MTSTRRIDGHEVALTNLDKVLFPASGVTKGELVDHYERFGALLLRHVEGRPLTLRRYPDGVDGDGWFQKHAPAHLPSWVPQAAIPSGRAAGHVRHILAEGPATLVYLANLAAIELHVGMAPASHPDQPDELVLDLDPPPGSGAEVIRRATRRCHALLSELGIEPRLKTSGSAGFHVHVALQRGVEQSTARDLARSLATVLAGRFPDELTVEHRLARRQNRVFVDWLRNSPRQTAIAPYSVRARDTAPVATPMDWSELPGTDPQRWTIRSLPRRLAQREDPWQSEPKRTDLRAIVPPLRAALAELP
jgi:bifunctional non-homologous end joining protein LigD